MPDASTQTKFRPVFIVEVYLKSGPMIHSTRDVEIVQLPRPGFGDGGFGTGGFGGGFLDDE